jgi:uncharacterized protein (DUF4213/DUF364 family)
MFQISQIGSVANYVERFSALEDQLAVYDSDPHTLYYAMTFVDGLCDEICPMVMAPLDSTCAFALV